LQRQRLRLPARGVWGIITVPGGKPHSSQGRPHSDVTIPDYVRHKWFRRTLATALVITGVLGAVIVGWGPRCRGGCPPLADAAVLHAPAQVTFRPASNAGGVNPVDPVSVTATSGTLTGVQMVNDAGTPVAGVLTPDHVVWHPVEPLGYGRTYTLTVASRGTGGVRATQVSVFATLVPPNQTKVSFTSPSEAPLQDGATYGVGTVVVAHFDEPIKDRGAAERRLTVTTSPPVPGSWFWVDDQSAHWRPEHYYSPHTTVTAEAKVYGIDLGNRLFGQEDTKVAFRIGDAHVSIADDKTKRVSVFDDGRLVRTMPTSMGMGGTQQVDGRVLSFWTPPGIYTVLDKANPVVMDSSTFGLPKNSRLGYRETINYATRISTDGIYLHQLDATVWAQGNTDTSHGCLNLNADNAEWFFGFSVPGDVVEIRNTGGPALTLSQGGDWTLPRDQWRNGSALR
jgi:lipoprotein-anchoring transpeptidase ErfK/SrfK